VVARDHHRYAPARLYDDAQVDQGVGRDGQEAEAAGRVLGGGVGGGREAGFVDLGDLGWGWGYGGVWVGVGVGVGVGASVTGVFA